MPDTSKRIEAKPLRSQVVCQSSARFYEAMDPLVVKDRQRTRHGYGSTTCDMPLDALHNTVRVSDQVLVSAIANLSTAYNLAIINYALMMVEQSYPTSSPEVRSTVDSCSLVGAIVGQLTFGYVGAVLGRKRGMIFTLVLSILGAAASGILPWGANSIYHILAACRFILGVGVGGVYPLSAASAVESASHDNELMQSRVVAAVFSFQGVGQLLAPLMAYIMLAMNIERSSGWRVLLLLGALPGLFVLQRAFKVKDESPWPVTPPLELRRSNIKVSYRSNLWAKLQDITLQRKFFGACASWFLFDVTYYGNVIFTPIVLQDTYDFDKHHLANVALCAMIVAAIALPGNLLTVLILGRLSFKTIQIVGFVIMALLFLTLGCFYNQLLHYRGLLLGTYALTFFFSNFGPNVGTFCIPAEIFPHDVRVELTGVAAAVGKLGAAIGAASFGLLEARCGVSSLLILSATVSLLGALVTHMFIPTKQYTT
ncbi:hypothetical protein PsorP6_000835 [Peronosclerospora sorghi]|uniref:Uncharacterized protein n=1 Tax=Peronosclerospora sorghi TaxID=230839 RepID=A0ACC0WRQ3_9STRA|nr:hypothetical protein PsorP6_000835 [Peronosclerospora sorghi]